MLVVGGGTADLVEPHAERNHRLLEEALEVVRSLCGTASDAHAGRQEMGSVTTDIVERLSKRSVEAVRPIHERCEEPFQGDELSSSRGRRCGHGSLASS